MSAVLLIKLNKIAEARAHLKEALRLQPGLSEAQIALNSLPPSP